MTSDKGTEVGKLIALVTALRSVPIFHYSLNTHLSKLNSRATYADVPEDLLPAFKAVKSTSNITRESNWRPLWEKARGHTNQNKIPRVQFFFSLGFG